MKLFLLRHGDRGGGYGDVGLSPEGQQQAAMIAADPQLQKATIILSSPKNRTQQTVQPLAVKLQIGIHVEIDLDQRKSIETNDEFTVRVIDFLESLPKEYPDDTVVLCSHSDWLQMAILNMNSSDTNNAIHCFFDCAEYKELIYKNGKWEVVEVAQ